MPPPTMFLPSLQHTLTHALLCYSHKTFHSISIYHQCPYIFKIVQNPSPSILLQVFSKSMNTQSTFLPFANLSHSKNLIHASHPLLKPHYLSQITPSVQCSILFTNATPYIIHTTFGRFSPIKLILSYLSPLPLYVRTILTLAQLIVTKLIHLTILQATHQVTPSLFKHSASHQPNLQLDLFSSPSQPLHSLPLDQRIIPNSNALIPRSI